MLTMINPLLVVALTVGLFVQAAPISKLLHVVEYLVDVEHRRESKYYPHPLERKPEIQAEIAAGLVVSSAKYNVPPLLIAAMTWKESRYRPDIISGETRGKLGERGLGQIHGVLARGCDLSGISGQLDCTARGLRMSMDACDGTVERGLTMYATGRCRVKRDSRAVWRIYTRLKLWQRLERISSGRQ